MNILRIALLIIILATLSGCDLLNQDSPQSLAYKNGIDNIGQLDKALTGAYNDLQEFTFIGATQNESGFQEAIVPGDMMADYELYTGSNTAHHELYNRQISTTNLRIRYIWNGSYHAINSANIVLDGINNLKNTDGLKKEVNNIQGQALFIRALCYYYLVQYYAKPWGVKADNSQPGVPLQLESITSESDFKKPSRSSVKEVYNQIIKDLRNAQKLFATTKRNRATKGACTALLARIALVQSRWKDAAQLANDVIKGMKYKLLPDVTTYFRNELSAESIFEVQNTQQDIAPGPNLTNMYNKKARDDIQITDAYKKDILSIITNKQKAALKALNETANDTRVTELLTGLKTPSEVSQATIASNTTKYESYVNLDDNIPVLRLPEMILTRAEALAELKGVNKQSIDLLNQIRSRAINVKDSNGNTVKNEGAIKFNMGDFSSKQKLINKIFLERGVELSFEGHRLFDLQRRKSDVRGLSWDSNRLVLPIPQSQIDANSNINQNPGY